MFWSKLRQSWYSFFITSIKLTWPINFIQWSSSKFTVDSFHYCSIYKDVIRQFRTKWLKDEEIWKQFTLSLFLLPWLYSHYGGRWTAVIKILATIYWPYYYYCQQHDIPKIVNQKYGRQNNFSKHINIWRDECILCINPGWEVK